MKSVFVAGPQIITKAKAKASAKATAEAKSQAEGQAKAQGKKQAQGQKQAAGKPKQLAKSQAKAKAHAEGQSPLQVEGDPEKPGPADYQHGKLRITLAKKQSYITLQKNGEDVARCLVSLPDTNCSHHHKVMIKVWHSILQDKMVDKAAIKSMMQQYASQ